MALLAAPALGLGHVDPGAPTDSATEMEYRVALEIHPGDVATRGRLARLLLARFRLGEAERELTAVLAMAPRDAAALADLGVLSALRGKPADAVAWFQRALAERQHDPATWLHLALALEQLGQLQPAVVACCTSLAQVKPGRESAEATATLKRLQGGCDGAIRKGSP